ncbi:hypothetical protein P12x_001565 [Tundrisphaera lichenicola]|uniref:hypothetical protein n=1 Tax=Tundrisphaera lichenicola TaxID=2029860 RepID=UPI003EB70F02
MRLARLMCFNFFLAIATYSPVWAQEPPGGSGGRKHGVNLGGGIIHYDNSSLIFADLIKGSGTFNGFKGAAPKPEYNKQGWPTRVDSKTGPTTLLVALNAHLPAGVYTLNAKGIGKIRVSGNFNDKNWCEVEFNGDGKPRTLKLNKSGVPPGWKIDIVFINSRADAPLRDLSFVIPGHAGKTFNQSFLDSLKPFSVLRAMDWQSTNGSTLVDWKDRVNSSRFSYYSRKRIEEEVICELANVLHKDLWICIPALASDDYVRQLAELVDRCLDKELTLYVEYSNEVWNTGMSQWSQHMKARAKEKEKLGEWEWIARRDGRLVNLFKQSLPSSRKCVRVLARQAGYQHTLVVALKQYKADGYGFDAISCTAYFMTKANLKAATAQYQKDPEGAVTKVIEGLDAAISESAKQIAWYQDRADENKVPLVIYEAGQHLVNWQDDKSTDLLTAVNRDPRMGRAYSKLIAALPAKLGPICWYYDCGSYTKWGYWGLKEYTGQPLKSAHKYRAVIESASPDMIESERSGSR